MRQRIVLVAVIAMALVAVFTVTTQGAAKPEIKYPAGCSGWTTVQKFHPFSERVWKESRWRRKPRGEPSQATIEAKQLRVKCAISNKHAVKMEKAWVKDRTAFMEHREKKMRAKRVREAKEALIAEHEPALAAIRACESGGDYSIVDSSGTYRGAYQFDQSTWESVGGSGDPAAASKFEQDYRAALLRSRSGAAPWPNCGV